MLKARIFFFKRTDAHRQTHTHTHTHAMRIPLRTFVFQPPAMTDLDSVRRALDGPVVVRRAVLDTMGEPYAYDVVVQDGFYLLVAAFVAWQALRAWRTRATDGVP